MLTNSQVFEKVVAPVVDAMVKNSLENSSKSLDIRLQTIQAIGNSCKNILLKLLSAQLLGTQTPPTAKPPTPMKKAPETSLAISTLPPSCVHSHVVYFLQVFDKCVTASVKDEYLMV